MRLLNSLKKYKKNTALISENKCISFVELEKYSNDLAKNFKKENLMFLICENNNAQDNSGARNSDPISTQL